MAGNLDDETRGVFTDVYRFLDRHWNIENTVSCWKEVAGDLQAICGKYPNDNFVMQLLIACYGELERHVCETV